MLGLGTHHKFLGDVVWLIALFFACLKIWVSAVDIRGRRRLGGLGLVDGVFERL